ncbi:MAG: type II secretion system F family protein [Clostridia bacterium]|nr:type II secretion system F family protein [Clostridia bacterium]
MFLYGRKTSKNLFCLHISLKVASMIIFASFPVFYLSFSKATGMEAAMACAMPVAGLILPDVDLNARIKRRREEILIDFPAFCTELAIMSGSGLEIQEAWRRASRKDTDSEFYREARFTISRTETGAMFRESLQEFSARMAIPEIHTFVSILSQAIKTGGGSLVEMLRNCACQSWEQRCENARKRGEEASTKLVFPLALGLAGIIIILTAPALIIMKGI